MARIHHLLLPSPLHPSLASQRANRRLPTVSSCLRRTGENDAHRGVDRRGLLLGLTGLCSSAGARSARGDPIQPPNLLACGPADVQVSGAPVNCCPPLTRHPVDFAPPPAGRLRVRRPAHLADAAYVIKYSRAVALMRALPPDDPRSFAQQAAVHCAYCTGAYDQAGLPPGLEIQVHSCWLFFPWHRLFLHFHERILAALLGDDALALPYWNYDSPAGMAIPAMYADAASPLYDPLRDPAHRPPAVVDLDHPGYGVATSDEGLVGDNLALMYRQMVSNGKTPEMFFGAAYRAGDRPNPGAGSIEQQPHNTVHVWTGDPSQPNGEDMNALYSSARDPIFFAHHANIDRLWYLWKRLDRRNKDIMDPNWLNTSFYFYDENAQLVRVKVQDSLDIASLGYTYEEVDLPWLHYRPTSQAPPTPMAPADIPTAQDITFPLVLNDSPISMIVRRPNEGRSSKEKAMEEEEEVLVVDGIHVDACRCAKFDVYVDAPESFRDLHPTACEKVGSFVNLSHGGPGRDAGKKMVQTKMRFGLTDLLELRGAEGHETLVVTLVPRLGGVSVGDVRVEFLPFAA